MLQALKNLESKAVRAPATKGPAQAVPVVEQKRESEPIRAGVAVASSAPTREAVIPRAVEVVDRLDAVLLEELSGVSQSAAVSLTPEGNDFGFTDFAFFGQSSGHQPAVPPIPVEWHPARVEPVRASVEGVGESTGYAPFASGGKPIAPISTGGTPPVAASIAKLPVETPAQKKLNLSPAVRAPNELERQVRWTLNDPVRSQPVVELVDRLNRDLEQISGKVVAFLTLGSEGSLPGPLLPVAVLLADQSGKQVLLVDGDTTRCRLSEGMKCGQQPGLTELLNSGAASKECCVPTATSGLSFLPAGQLRHYDVSSAGAGLEKSLQNLTNEHGCVLIEVGTADSPNAASLARQADATYLVVELGAVETIAARKALNDLRATGARVLGCIAT